jgi:hypothetical protein
LLLFFTAREKVRLSRSFIRADIMKLQITINLISFKFSISHTKRVYIYSLLLCRVRWTEDDYILCVLGIFVSGGFVAGALFTRRANDALGLNLIYGLLYSDKIISKQICPPREKGSFTLLASSIIYRNLCF